MNILATEKFATKIKTLNEPYKASIRQFFTKIKSMEDSQLFKILLGAGKKNDISVYKIDTLRLFYNFTDDKEGKNVLVFIDLTFDKAALNQPRDPRYNSDINPK